MKTKLISMLLRFTTVVGLFGIAGCVAPAKYKPARYSSAQDRFGAIPLKTDKKVYICPVIDSIPPECKKFHDPSFSLWLYATEALEEEFKASGIVSSRPAFAVGPSFDSLRQAIVDGADKKQESVYLGVEIFWATQTRWVFDAKLYSPKGNVLFEKRATCLIARTHEGKEMNADQKAQQYLHDAQEVTHMTIRQIIADPNFQKELK